MSSASRMLLGSQSTSSSFNSKLDLAADAQLKWESVKKFIYLATTVYSGLQTFDLFSGYGYRENNLIFFVLLQLIFGMSYLYADIFIKQYTGKLDCNINLNPMLKGISYGIFFQTLAWCLIHSHDLADSIYYFSAVFSLSPHWDDCPDKAKACLIGSDIYSACTRDFTKFELANTTSYQNYVRFYKADERSVLTTRLFLVGIVWVLNFFFASINEQSFVKVRTLSFLTQRECGKESPGPYSNNLQVYNFPDILRHVCRCSTEPLAGEYDSHLAVYLTIVTYNWILRLFFILRFTTSVVFFLVVFNTFSSNISETFSNMFGGPLEEYMETARFVAILNGIGYVGVCDFGTMSPYTPVDTAVIYYAIFATVTTIGRSLVIKALINAASSCLTTPHKIYTPHYVIFGLYPICTHIRQIQRFYTFCIYLDVVLTVSTSLAMATLSLAKLLHSEFQSIKYVYFVGILCFAGFFFSLPVGSLTPRYPFGIYEGMIATSYFLGSARMAIIMWLYGVDKFATDVHFWLGYKPTKYWLVTWSITPAIFMFIFVRRLVLFVDMTDEIFVRNMGLGWIIFILTIVILSTIKTIASHVIAGNFAGIFRNSQKYGPPDVEERKRRRRYNEAVDFRQCKHECMMLDDFFDCNHSPIKRDGELDSSSLQDIFLSGTNRRKVSSVIEIG